MASDVKLQRIQMWYEAEDNEFPYHITMWAEEEGTGVPMTTEGLNTGVAVPDLETFVDNMLADAAWVLVN